MHDCCIRVNALLEYFELTQQAKDVVFSVPSMLVVGVYF